MLYALYRIGFFLVKLLPRRVSYSISETIAVCYAFFAKRDKKALRANLRIVLGDDVSPALIDGYITGVFRNFAKYLVDFFTFHNFTEEYIYKHIIIEGRRSLDECLAKGKGVIVASLHLGNWELGGAVVGGLGYSISAIVLEHADKRIDDLFARQRAINGLKAIPLDASIKGCFSALKRNEMLAIVGDKDYTSSGIYVNFFGRKALMPKGPAIFSLRTGAPIIVCAVIREKDDSYRMVFQRPAEPSLAGDYKKDVRALIEAYLKLFEKHIRENPDQWYVFRELWEPEKTIQS